MAYLNLADHAQLQLLAERYLTAYPHRRAESEQRRAHAGDDQHWFSTEMFCEMAEFGRHQGLISQGQCFDLINAARRILHRFKNQQTHNDEGTVP